MVSIRFTLFFTSLRIRVFFLSIFLLLLGLGPHILSPPPERFS